MKQYWRIGLCLCLIVFNAAAWVPKARTLWRAPLSDQQALFCAMLTLVFAILAAFEVERLIRIRGAHNPA